MARLKVFRIALFASVGASLLASAVAIFAASTAVRALNQVSARDRLDATVIAIRQFEAMSGGRTTARSCLKVVAKTDEPTMLESLLKGEAWSAPVEDSRLLSSCRSGLAKPDAQGLVAITAEDSKAIVNRATDAMDAYNFLFNRAFNGMGDCRLIERSYRDVLTETKDSFRFAMSNVAAHDPKRWRYPALERYLERGCG